MKRTKILKAVIILIMGIVLFTMATKVFALDDSDSELNFYVDQSNLLDTNDVDDEDTNTSTSTSTNTNTNTNTSTNINTNTTTNVSNYNTNLPKAGAPENTMMGVAVTILGITAVYAYKKIREYKNI